jgi:hypothetical protein
MFQPAPHPVSRFIAQDYNRFLFAPVGTDRAGGQLSVVSALARLDLDAWAEASSLARLPRDAAVVKLSGMLRRYPEITQLAGGPAVVAARLIGLLPGAAIRPAQTAAPVGLTSGNIFIALAMFAGLCMAIGLQFAAFLPHAPHAHSAAARVAVQATPNLVPAPNQQ